MRQEEEEEEEKEQRGSFEMYGRNRSGTARWARAQTPLVRKLRLSFQSSIVRIAHSARVDTPQAQDDVNNK
jgi:hypothetical protein